MKITRYVFYVVQIGGQTIHYGSESYVSYAQNLLLFLVGSLKKSHACRYNVYYGLAVGSYVRLLEQVNVGILTEEANEQNYANIFNKVRASFHFFLHVL